MDKDLESQTNTTLLVLVRDPANAQAWNAFVHRYGQKILAWCRQWHLQRADAEDVTQSVLTKLLEHFHSFRYDPSKGHFRGWLRTVTQNAWIDFRKSRERAGWGSGDPRIQELLQSLEAQGSLVQTLDEVFERELVEEAKARVRLRVHPRTWQAFQLLAIDKRPGAEVAAVLDMKVAAVYVAKDRVQRMLREEIAKLEEEIPEEKENRK